MPPTSKSLLSFVLSASLVGGSSIGALVAGSTVATPAAQAATKGRTPVNVKRKAQPTGKTKATGRPTSGRRSAGRKSAARKPIARAKAGKKRKAHVFLDAKVPAFTNKGQLPNVQAQGALVVDLDSGQELFSRKPDVARPIASISKLAAMLVVMDRKLDLDGLTTIKKVDVEVARGGATSRLREDMTLTNRDLLHAAMMGSDNRAVSALGRAVGLSATQFAFEMTRKAASLGLRHTHFREPTGLSPDNQSTPRETIVMLREVMKHPILGAVTRKVEYDAHPVSRPPIKYITTHRPAARSNVAVLGGKTGYNDLARYCLVIATRVDGRNLAMALLGTEGKLTRFGDVARVADWVVLHKPKASVVAQQGAGAAGSPATPAASALPPAATAATTTAAAATAAVPPLPGESPTPKPHAAPGAAGAASAPSVASSPQNPAPL